MGLKARIGGNDFANKVMALTSGFPEPAVFIAGHTHQAIPSRLTNDALFTQADHFGIHMGRVDLLFDRNSRKLLHREAICELMDNRFQFDPVVISRAKSDLAESEVALSQPIGELAETLHARSRPGEPSDIERLIGAEIIETLQERSVPIDGVMHGVFDDKARLVAGPKTVNDIWNLIPYENYIVTAELLPEEIKAVMEEVYASHEKRNLLGFEVKTEGRAYDCRIKSMTLAGGGPLERGKKYVLAFNTFDSRSAGHHFMKLRALLETHQRTASCIKCKHVIRLSIISGVTRLRTRLSPPESRRQLHKWCEIALEKLARSACVSAHAWVCILLDCSVFECPSCLVAGKRHSIGAGFRAADVSAGFTRAGSKYIDQSHRRTGLDQERPKGCFGYVYVFGEKDR
jgi:5'-nucleotidase-like protein